VPATWDLYDVVATKEFMIAHRCFGEKLEELRSQFESIKFSGLIDSKPSTQQVREKSDSMLTSDKWNHRVLITEDFPAGVSKANYEVDYQTQYTCESCNRPHQLSLELGFDNRQAVGSNLLKMDSANSGFNGESISIIVVTNSKGRESGRWDNSVAIDYDYSWAYRKAYSKYFKTVILLLTIY
jgi:hypothetical protein